MRWQMAGLMTLSQQNNFNMVKSKGNKDFIREKVLTYKPDFDLGILEIG